MNAAQIHLALNHVPLFLSLIGGLVLILGIFRKNNAFITLSLFMLIAGALFTAPVFLTGEGTEELVEKAAGVNEAAIESHEDMAQISLIGIILTGVFALAGYVLRNRQSIYKGILTLTVLFSLASFVTMAQTAHLGGLIRHTELQTGQAGGNNESGREDEEKEKKKKNEPGLLNPENNKADSTGYSKKEGKEDDDD
ncbi:MAG: hypothetical protein IAE96_02360 [Chitinophagaceae bacterium]|nr:hypothetical protein [Chitinophagaceae bacterium]